MPRCCNHREPAMRIVDCMAKNCGCLTACCCVEINGFPIGSSTPITGYTPTSVRNTFVIEKETIPFDALLSDLRDAGLLPC